MSRTRIAKPAKQTDVKPSYKSIQLCARGILGCAITLAARRVRASGSFCMRHAGDRVARCRPMSEIRSMVVGKCLRHGGGRRCLHPTPNGPCQRFIQGGGGVPACIKHGGGPRCKSKACEGLTSPSFAKYKRRERQPLCWGCFSAQYPVLDFHKAG